MSGRTSAGLVLVVGTVAGAAVGAGLHPAPKFRYTAEAVIDSHGARSDYAARKRLARLVETFDLGQVTQAVRETTNLTGDIRNRVTVSANSATDLVRVKARERSPTAAVALANAYATQAVNFVKVLDSVRGERLPLGDFESGLDGWSAVSRFAAPPTSLRVVHNTARFSSSALRVTCAPQAGCGPSLHIYYPFEARTIYEAAGWARASTGRPRTTMVFGANPSDYTAIVPIRLRKSWTRYRVRWNPRHDHPVAELTFQTAAKRPAQFYVDGVSMSVGVSNVARRSDGGANEARVFTNRLSADISPASPGRTIRSRTARWAVIGAVVGLAAALWTVGIGWSATRRRQN